MALKKIKGIVGKVYMPDNSGPKKHNCKDCFHCQICSDERCLACLKNKSKKRLKKQLKRA
jgi:hypothetical protein